VPKPSTGFRLRQIGLDDDLVERFTDFREAGYLGAPEHRVIAEALEFFMAQRLNRNPDVREAYEEARRRRQRR
jgi:hypothetical protein